MASNKNTEIDIELQKLFQFRKEMAKEIKRIKVRIFKTETEQLVLGKDGPITKTIENYTYARKDLISYEMNDGDRVFSGVIPKLKRRET